MVNESLKRDAKSQDVQSENKKISKPQLNPLPTFTEIGSGTVVADANNGYGVAWNIGWENYINKTDPNYCLDLFLANYNASDKFFKNNGAGTFSEIAGPFNNTNASYGVAWADIDNDDLLDFCVTSEDGIHIYWNRSTFFQDIRDDSAEPNMAFITNGRGVAWADMNNDGYVDLYVAVYGASNCLYKNNGDRTFINIALDAKVDDNLNSTGVAWCDFDNDDDMDLYVCNDGGPNRLYQNKYNSTGDFENIAATAKVEDSGNSIGVDWGDYNRDDKFDLFITNVGTSNKLYRNEGASFADATTSSGVSYIGNSYGCSWMDFDYDGDLDLYVAVANAQNRCYINDGDGNFTYDIPYDLADSDNSRCITWGDFDNDGDLDLYVSNYGNENRLYQNDGTENNYLIVEAIGSAESMQQTEIKKVHEKKLQSVSNRAGIGARIKIVTFKTGPSPFPDTLVQIREVSGGSGYMSQNSLPVEFGLGQESKIDSLIIKWPSGLKQVFTDSIPINKTVMIIEGDSTIYTKKISPPGKYLPDIRVVPNPYIVALNAGMQSNIRFMELPPRCTIKIFTESGDLVTTLDHTDGSGSESWDLFSRYNKVIASGIYIAYIEVTEDYKNPTTGTPIFRKGQSTTTKFIIIR